MAAALPVTKLAGLFVKTLAKPLSKRIKYDFARFDATKRILMSIGQTNHTVTSYMTIWSSGYKVKSIKPIDTEKALKDGAEFVGEGFVLTVSASIVIWEYNRSAQKLIEKNEQKRERIKADQIILQAKLRTLDIRIKAVEDLIKKQQNLDDKSLLRAVTVSKKPKYIEPPKETLVTIVDDDEYDDDANSHSTESLEPLSIGKQNKSWWQFW
mmetsp:Transcript_11171/g.12629  ORF Transcript_11171/g.12629 Transcript_11171/m.12629 type:complete len:211 (-) Transcript_11171:1645-2277(-)